MSSPRSLQSWRIAEVSFASAPQGFLLLGQRAHLESENKLLDPFPVLLWIQDSIIVKHRLEHEECHPEPGGQRLGLARCLAELVTRRL